mmetsp:Transcript_31038/g.35449  ORF Transcript_31038/g.35449 Transcript_31038/m.35449 type:complete len:92 (+) Transcript_31038:20-295(+)
METILEREPEDIKMMTERKAVGSVTLIKSSFKSFSPKLKDEKSVQKDSELQPDKRLKLITKETLKFMSEKTRKFKFELNNLKNKVHSLQKK